MEDETGTALGRINQLNIKIRSLVQDLREHVTCLAELSDVNSEIKGLIGKYESELTHIQVLVEETENKKHREELSGDMELQRQQLNSLRITMRKANVVCTTRLEKENREALLAGGDSGRSMHLRSRSNFNRQNVHAESSQITENLSAVSRMLAEQVDKNRKTIEVLEDSSRNIGSTNEELKSMTGVIGTSRKLLSKYDRRALTDKLLIFLALTLFLGTVLYIVKKRIWPTWF